MVRLTRKERQDKVNLLASINKVNIGDEVEATDNGKWNKQMYRFFLEILCLSCFYGKFCVFLLWTLFESGW